MKLPEYTGQKTGIYYLPTIGRLYPSEIWVILLGLDYKEKFFSLDFKNKLAGHSLLDIFWWCEDHCNSVVFLDIQDCSSIGFYEKDDAVQFKLTWIK